MIVELHRTATEQVYEHVRESIRTGALQPGERIDQASLSRQFGTSIVPVREALARLQSSGLVQIVAHRGAFVVPMSRDELIDICSTRELLEELAARLSAPNLTDADLEELERLLYAMRAAAADADYQALFDLNRRFHLTIYQASRRRHLLQIIEQLWDRNDRFLRTYLADTARADDMLTEHDAILHACQRRDPVAVGLTIRFNVHQTTVGLLDAAHNDDSSTHGATDAPSIA